MDRDINLSPRPCHPRAALRRMLQNDDVFDACSARMQGKSWELWDLSQQGDLAASKGYMILFQIALRDITASWAIPRLGSAAPIFRTPSVSMSAFEKLCIAGNEKLAEILLRHQVVTGRPTISVIEGACRAGRTGIVALLTQYKFPASSTAMDSAAAAGNLELTSYLHFNRTEGCSRNAMNRAAVNDHVQVLQFLHEHRTEGCSSGLADQCAASGALRALKWLQHHLRSQVSIVGLRQAARNGHLNVLRSIASSSVSYLIDHTVLEEAFAGGHLPIVEYFLANRHSPSRPPLPVSSPRPNDQITNQQASLTQQQQRPATRIASRTLQAVAGKLSGSCSDLSSFQHQEQQHQHQHQPTHDLHSGLSTPPVRPTTTPARRSRSSSSLTALESLASSSPPISSFLPYNDALQHITQRALPQLSFAEPANNTLQEHDDCEEVPRMSTLSDESLPQPHTSVAQLVQSPLAIPVPPPSPHHSQPSELQLCEGQRHEQQCSTDQQQQQEQHLRGSAEDSFELLKLSSSIPDRRQMLNHFQQQEQQQQQQQQDSAHNFPGLGDGSGTDTESSGSNSPTGLEAEPPICTIKCLENALSNDHIELARWFMSRYPEAASSETLTIAASKGLLDICTALHQTGHAEVVPRAIDLAAANGHLEVLHWATAHLRRGTPHQAMNLAATNGQLECLKFLHQFPNYSCSATAMDCAARNGHMDVVVWLHENRSEGCTSVAYQGAVMNGHDAMAQWLLENRPEHRARRRGWTSSTNTTPSPTAGSPEPRFNSMDPNAATRLAMSHHFSWMGRSVY